MLVPVIWAEIVEMIRIEVKRIAQLRDVRGTRIGDRRGDIDPSAGEEDISRRDPGFLPCPALIGRQGFKSEAVSRGFPGDGLDGRANREFHFFLETKDRSPDLDIVDQAFPGRD